jgi:hypothetical protein
MLEDSMLKNLLITTAVSGLMITGAFAQGSTTAPAPGSAPATTNRAAPAPADSAKFIPAQGADQWVFSKFKGTDVLGADDAHVGDVNDLLFDKQGKVDGVIVGVGGFLGIGEKNVAIDLSAFQVVPADANNADPNNVKLKVAWTKDQLKNAPDFQYYKSSASRTSSGTSSGAPRTEGAAPANRAPATPAPATPAPSRP